MRRLLPKSLAGQTILVLLLGLTFSHVLSMAIYSSDRAEVLMVTADQQMAHRIAENAPLSNYAITQALPRIAELAASDGLFVESLMASIAQGDEAAKERVRAFLDKRAGKVAKSANVG